MDEGTIKIRTSFLFQQFFLFFFKPIISIDGSEPQKYSWGESAHEVAPGNHTVDIAISYFFGWEVAKASQTVSVGASETVAPSYRAPLIVTSAGCVRTAPV